MWGGRIGTTLRTRCVALGLAVALLQAAPSWSQPAAQYLVGLSGMNCPETCGPETLQRLQNLAGVADVELNPNTKTALVTMAAGSVLTRAAVSNALKGSEVGVTTLELVRHAPAAK